MTKVIILGEKPQEVKKKPIKFKMFLERGLIVSESVSRPKEFKFIELIRLEYTNELDLMFAYNDDRNMGCLFLGKFNDGIV